MSGTLSLNGTWGLTYAEDSPEHLTAPTLCGRRLLDAAVPAPIHRVLRDAGWIEDPILGLGSLRARWVEEMFWVYRRAFEAPAEAAQQRAWLVFERLEMNAAVWLNGSPVGQHANAHRPARFDVTGVVQDGQNTLVVQVESGLRGSLDRPSSEYAFDWFARMTRRHWDRKPQYQCGWDWNPRLMNVGILGEVRLEWRAAARIDEVTVFAVTAADLGAATLHVRATVEGAREAEVPATLRARVLETGQTAQVSVATGAAARHELTIALEEPRLWWPLGHGEQARYTVEVTLEAGDESETVTRRTGVRRVEIDQSPHPVEGRHCVLKVNNRPIFCKGGNWVPPDMFYSEVDSDRYRALVDLAVGANFNLLRVWGGGPFADHALCDACDEAGVLLWHDFLFACAKYPGDDPAFAAEVRREVTGAVRDLARHPSIVVWCGNNEIEWGDWGWGYDDRYRTHPHYAIFHHDIPRIVLEEDPSTLHWISSPWSPDFRHPNDPTLGDQHPWDVSIMQPGAADWWHYRGCVDRFPNEGGVLGCSSPATLRAFLPEGERCLLSPSWHHHDNPLGFLSGQPGEAGRTYQTVQLWTGRDPLAMEIDDYAFVSGLLQAEGLQEYIANYRRRMFSTASAIFWMYNDSWPTTHGWTIVDYYLRKKLSYHPVRRAFQPVTVVAAREGEEMLIVGVNDAPRTWVGEARFGVFGLRGGLPLDERRPAVLNANAATELGRFPLAALRKAGTRDAGVFAVLEGPEGPIAQQRLFVERFGDLRFARPDVRVGRRDGVAELASDVFVWGVCLDVEGEAAVADNCFDLLPGVPYRLPWPDEAPPPAVARIGSRDAVAPSGD
ncbi:MAG: hypothetical protein IT208_03435 [Chthonomonadales bacterium]|nr:hypothetical protein [Chthonomonadales bacterium]